MGKPNLVKVLINIGNKIKNNKIVIVVNWIIELLIYLIIDDCVVLECY